MYGRESLAIGIDLGTHSCRVAICRHGKVEILANDEASRATPSWVSFTDAGRLVGDAAKNQAAFNEKNTVYGVKRLMGRKFSDEAVQSGIEHWPFNVVNVGGRPRVSVECGGETKQFKPEEITAVILAKMKETAEAFIGEKVKDAVITVPRHYNFHQRQAIKIAGTIAGLNVTRIEIEQEAVIVAYNNFVRPVGIEHVLIFNLGAATFEVSVFPVNHFCPSDVKATSGGAHLGGEDFDNRLVAHCLREFTRKHDKDISKNLKAMGRLKMACELAKITLSSCTEASIEIEALLEGIDFCIQISRHTFEDLCDDLFRSTIESVESFLMATKLDKRMIDDVVLVGGSTRIPKVQKLLTDFFNGKVPNTSMDPEEAFVLGAAMLAEELEECHYVDNCISTGNAKVSLGVETAGGVMTMVVTKRAVIPCVTSLTFSTHSANLSGVTLRVFKWKSSTAKDKDLIGKIGLKGIAPAPRGVPQIQVTFEIGVKGVLYVTVQDKSTTKFNHIHIKAWDRNYYTIGRVEFTSLTSWWETVTAINTPKSELPSPNYELEDYDYTPKAVCDKLSTPATITARSPWTVGMKWLNEFLHIFFRLHGKDARQRQVESSE